MTCVGHIIGAVVTDTREHAQRAAQAVKITYEDLPAIITIEVTEKGLHGESEPTVPGGTFTGILYFRGDSSSRWDFIS